MDDIDPAPVADEWRSMARKFREQLELRIAGCADFCAADLNQLAESLRAAICFEIDAAAFEQHVERARNRSVYDTD